MDSVWPNQPLTRCKWLPRLAAVILATEKPTSHEGRACRGQPGGGVGGPNHFPLFAVAERDRAPRKRNTVTTRTTSDIPATPADVTPEWLSATLGKNGT